MLQLKTFTPSDRRLSDIWDLLPRHQMDEWNADRRFWIAGGAPRRVMQGVDIPNDVDLFFTGRKAFDDLMRGVPKHWITADKPHAVEFRIPRLQRPSMASTGSPGASAPTAGYTVQACRHAFFYSIENLLEDFDFRMCLFAFDGTRIYYTEEALRDVQNMELHPNNITMPTAAFRRLIKYREQGFRAPDETIRAILRAAVKDPNSINKEVVCSDVSRSSSSTTDPIGELTGEAF